MQDEASSWLSEVKAKATAIAEPIYYDDEDEQSLIWQAAKLALAPVRILTTRAAVKTYLSTILFLSTSLVLLLISSTAFGLFYYNYIPQINLERTLYLQYASSDTPSTHPYAAVAFDAGALISQQAYDISVVLDMPRTRKNLDAGNFMLDLSLISPKELQTRLSNSSMQDVQLQARRPAILPYSSPALSLSHTVLHLPWHLLGMWDLDRSILVVPMFEMVSFARGQRNVPSHARLEVQGPGGYAMQVYGVRLVFCARFQGLRYWIYNYRVAAFLLFTVLFYLVSVGSLVLVWAVISNAWSSSGQGMAAKPGEAKQIKTEGEYSSAATTARIKTEDDSASSTHGGLSMSNVSDTPVQYPTGRGRPSLSYSGRPGPSEVATQAADEDERLKQPIGAGEAADVEDEGEDEHHVVHEENDGGARAFDSGIGTSMESEGVGGNVGLARRRSSKGMGRR